jgi:hypothetical protein
MRWGPGARAAADSLTGNTCPTARGSVRGAISGQDPINLSQMRAHVTKVTKPTPHSLPPFVPTEMTRPERRVDGLGKILAQGRRRSKFKSQLAAGTW